jgi:hypothetical protein
LHHVHRRRARNCRRFRALLAFQQEYLAFLERHKLGFEDKYLWNSQ